MKTSSAHLLIAFFCEFISQASFGGKDNYLGFEYGIFGIKAEKQSIISNGLFEKLNQFDGDLFSMKASFPLFEYSRFDIGVGLSQLSFQKEVEGVFPETGNYGSGLINAKAAYWSFPISVCVFQRSYNVRYGRRNCYGSRYRNISGRGLRITYLPSVASNTSLSIQRLGGAVDSKFLDEYKLDNLSFQHSLLIALANSFPVGDNGLLSVDPFIGLGSGYFRNTGRIISTVSYGVNMSLQLKFSLPSIHIEKDDYQKRKEKEEKLKQLKQKQEEIDKQLKDKKQKPK